MNDVRLEPEQVPARAELLLAAELGEDAPGRSIYARLEPDGDGDGEPAVRIKVGAVLTRRLYAAEATEAPSGAAYGNPLRGRPAHAPSVPIGSALLARTDTLGARGWRVYRVARRTGGGLFCGSGQSSRGEVAVRHEAVEREAHFPDGCIDGEIWTYVRKKQRHVEDHEAWDPEVGDQYVFIGFDPFSKLIAAHVVGKRHSGTTTDFIEQIEARIPGRIQLFTDGYQEYLLAVEGVYGDQAIDYAQVIKPVKGEAGEPGHVETIVWFGSPRLRQIGTSYVERNNGTIRNQLRRFTRRTLAFSKLLRNLRAAVALYVAWYDFCRPHGALDGMTPAMALGIAETFWEIDRLLP